MGEFSESTKGVMRYTNESGIIFEIVEKDGRYRAEAINREIGVGWGDRNIKRFARYLESIEDEECLISDTSDDKGDDGSNDDGNSSGSEG